jgi:biopolymer transport protein ExbD
MAGMSSERGPEINVTPLVDVCLVLLIIFMVLIPKSVPELSVQVPHHGDRSRRGNETLTLGLDAAGVVSLNGRALADRDTLQDTLAMRLEGREKKVVYADFDDDANYGEAVALLAAAKHSGAVTLAIVQPRGAAPDTLIGLP